MNKDIKMKMIMEDVRQYQVAERLGISEFTLSRKMRKELLPDEKEEILKIIDKIAEGRR